MAEVTLVSLGQGTVARDTEALRDWPVEYLEFKDSPSRARRGFADENEENRGVAEGYLDSKRQTGWITYQDICDLYYFAGVA
jgi:hypothetical protein